MVRGKLEECWRALELALPVVELRPDGALLDRGPLPRRPVQVLHAQRRQRIRLPSREGIVKREQLVEEDVRRGRVGDRVMHADQQRVVILAQPDEAEAVERPLVESEGRLRVALRGGQERCLTFRKPGPILQLEAESGGRADDLPGAPFLLNEDGPQDLVPLDDRLQGPDERLRIDPASQPDRAGAAVHVGTGVQLLEEPEPLLPQRQRHGLARRDDRDGRRLQAPLGLALAQQQLHHGSLLGGAQVLDGLRTSAHGVPPVTRAALVGRRDASAAIVGAS